MACRQIVPLPNGVMHTTTCRRKRADLTRSVTATERSNPVPLPPRGRHRRKAMLLMVQGRENGRSECCPVIGQIRVDDRVSQILLGAKASRRPFGVPLREKFKNP